MKNQLSKFIYGFLLTVAGFTCSLSAEIIETNEIKSMVSSLNQDSFVFFNVTGTLYAPSNVLSDRRWREYFADRVKEVVNDDEAAEQLINKVKNQIVTSIPKKKIEDITPPLIALMQAKEIVVLGITQKQMATSYAKNFGEITHHHLRRLGINLQKTLKYFQFAEKDIENSNFSFAYGILFTNKQPVGPSLLSFLKGSPKQPSNVVMIDNSRDSLESAQESLSAAGISFTGIRYGRADQEEDFDPTLGTVEFFALINDGKILSDEEAVQVMPKDKTINYELMLDRYIEQVVSLESSTSQK